MKPRILRILSAIEGPRREDFLRLFSEAEADAVLALLAEMVRDGELREKEGRFWEVRP